MANVKISALPSATSVANADVLPLVQSGTTKKVTAPLLSAFATGVQNVKHYGAVGDGVTNDTAAIQSAIDTGLNLLFPAGTYLVSGLTQSTNFQRWYAAGHVDLKKNGNGPILTATGNYLEFNGIQFVGTGYTGDNVSLTGSHPRLVNCASYGAAGRAVKATGAHVQIIGTCGAYATTDATASGYDIEIGVSGTATLYHQLVGVYSSQATGGILLIDTGSHVISGGQFGKLTIQAGTTPAGVNGGMTANARILGNVSVGLSSAVFTGNQFSTQTITFEVGTGQHTLDLSNNTVNATIVNNGNGNSIIMRATSAGGTTDFAFGPSAWTGSVKVDNANQWTFPNHVTIENGFSLRVKDSGGTEQVGVNLSAGNDWTLGSNTGAGNFLNVVSGDGGVYLVPGGTTAFQAITSAFRPQIDAGPNLGSAGQRWNTVYASTGTINTSDARVKTEVRSLTDAERRVALTLKSLVRAFRFTDAVEAKGEAARVHIGVIAQEVMAAFAAEGLDPMQYGVVCFDTWPESSAGPAGERYGIRYEELLAFIVAAL